MVDQTLQGAALGPLTLLQNVVNETDDPISVTLLVGGMVVSGNLISRKAYAEKFIKDIEKAVGGREVDADGAGVKALAAPPPEGKLDPFVHLSGAQFFAPGAAPIPTTGTHMRITTAAVDGFIFGKLGPSEDEKPPGHEALEKITKHLHQG